MKRSTILDPNQEILDEDGTLTILVDLNIYMETLESPTGGDQYSQSTTHLSRPVGSTEFAPNSFNMQSKKLTIHSFADRTEKPGEPVSMVARAHGRVWKLLLHPRGSKIGTLPYHDSISFQLALAAKMRQTFTGMVVFRCESNNFMLPLGERDFSTLGTSVSQRLKLSKVLDPDMGYLDAKAAT